MPRKILASITIIIFLIVSSSCSHSPPKPASPNPREEVSSPREIARSLSNAKQEDRWWKKAEYEWMLALLILLGIGLATSASMIIVYNAGGLSVTIHK